MAIDFLPSGICQNAQDLPALLELQKAEHIDKFYLSHLNYSGRGKSNRGRDAHFEITKWALDLLFTAAWQSAQLEDEREFVTGNNDTDGVYLLFWVRDNFPEMENHVRAKLAQWGGNSSGVNIANIDNLGNVHPDSFWWDYTLGSIRERPFSQIWTDHSDPLIKGLKAEQRKIGGRCGRCSSFDVCNGNTRVRAFQVHHDAWAEDPGCYLDNDELGLEEDQKTLSL